MNRVDNLIKNKYIADIEEKLIVKPDLIGINNRLNVNRFYDPLIEQKSIQTARCCRSLRLGCITRITL
jgi:hypothetical protein